jgi:hypothetical protein
MLEQAKVEFTSVDIGFGKMLGLVAQSACDKDLLGLLATHHRRFVQAQ